MFESPVVTVHLPAQLRQYAAGRHEITASGDTVGELRDAVAHEYPTIRPHLMSAEGQLIPGLLLYLGGQEVSRSQGMATPVELAEVLSIVPNGQ